MPPHAQHVLGMPHELVLAHFMQQKHVFCTAGGDTKVTHWLYFSHPAGIHTQSLVESTRPPLILTLSAAGVGNCRTRIVAALPAAVGRAVRLNLHTLATRFHGCAYTRARMAQRGARGARSGNWPVAIGIRSWGLQHCQPESRARCCGVMRGAGRVSQSSSWHAPEPSEQRHTPL